MTKDEMKNRISMALKDPILQQGFEIICKNLDELEKENAELKERETEAEVIIDKFLDFESSAMECGLTLCGDTHKRAVRFLEED